MAPNLCIQRHTHPKQNNWTQNIPVAAREELGGEKRLPDHLKQHWPAGKGYPLFLVSGDLSQNALARPCICFFSVRIMAEKAKSCFSFAVPPYLFSLFFLVTLLICHAMRDFLCSM
jgi:hypothetical protein